jgi:hypothetical protein
MRWILSRGRGTSRRKQGKIPKSAQGSAPSGAVQKQSKWRGLWPILGRNGDNGGIIEPIANPKSAYKSAL